MSTEGICLAAVEIGPAALRLAVAEVDGRDRRRRLGLLRGTGDWAREVLVRGRIGEPTIRSMTDALRGFTRVIRDYGISGSNRFRAAAFEPMSAARNAAGFQACLMAETGIFVDILRPDDERRLARLGVRRLLDKRPELAGRDLLALDVGWSRTLWMALRDGRVLASGCRDLGALRLRLDMEARRTPGSGLRSVVNLGIDPAVEAVHRDAPSLRSPLVVALSAPARLAADRLQPGWRENGGAVLETEDLAAFARRISLLPVHRVVRILPAGASEAAIAGPGMLAYVHLARAFGAGDIIVLQETPGDLLLAETAAPFERVVNQDRYEAPVAAEFSA